MYLSFIHTLCDISSSVLNLSDNTADVFVLTVCVDNVNVRGYAGNRTPVHFSGDTADRVITAVVIYIFLRKCNLTVHIEVFQCCI